MPCVAAAMHVALLVRGTYMCLLDQSGVTGGGLDPYNHYNTCFVCKHRQHVDGNIWKSAIVLLIKVNDASLIHTIYDPYFNCLSINV